MRAVAIAFGIRISDVAIAMLLISRWQRACKEWQPAVDAFEHLTRSVGEDNASAWTREADQADADRLQDVSIMDIYSVDSVQSSQSFLLLLQFITSNGPI